MIPNHINAKRKQYLSSSSSRSAELCFPKRSYILHSPLFRPPPSTHSSQSSIWRAHRETTLSYAMKWKRKIKWSSSRAEKETRGNNTKDRNIYLWFCFVFNLGARRQFDVGALSFYVLIMDLRVYHNHISLQPIVSTLISDTRQGNNVAVSDYFARYINFGDEYRQNRLLRGESWEIMKWVWKLFEFYKFLLLLPS